MAWDVQYEANELPDAATPVWVKTGDATTIEISPAGYLHVDSSTDGLYYDLEDANLDLGSTSGITVKVRMRLLSGYNSASWAGYPSLFIYYKPASGLNRLLDVYWATDQLFTRGGEENEFYDMDTTDDYHTYTFTINENGYKAYVDSVLRCWGTYIQSGNTPLIRFKPEEVGTEGVETSLDYLYYRTGGAFPPSVNISPFPTHLRL